MTKPPSRPPAKPPIYNPPTETPFQQPPPPASYVPKPTNTLIIVLMCLGAVAAMMAFFWVIFADPSPPIRQRSNPSSPLPSRRFLPPRKATPQLEVLSYNAKQTNKDAGGSLDYWSWKVEILNRASTGVDYSLTFQFLDSDGYELDMTFEIGTIPPGRHSVTGKEALFKEASKSVASFKVTVEEG